MSGYDVFDYPASIHNPYLKLSFLSLFTLTFLILWLIQKVCVTFASSSFFETSDVASKLQDAYIQNAPEAVGNPVLCAQPVINAWKRSSGASRDLCRYDKNEQIIRQGSFSLCYEKGSVPTS